MKRQIGSILEIEPIFSTGDVMHSRFWQKTAVFIIIVALFPLLIYLATTPPDLTLAHFGTDGGELITAAVTLGVPHPPGYPSYVLLGKLFSLLPVGTIAFRLHLFSVVSAALAAGFLADGLRRFVPTAAAVSAAYTLAFCQLVWGQAIIAEVYAPALLFITLTLWAVYTKKPLWLTAVFWGIAITFHLTAVFLAPILIAHPRPKQGSAPLHHQFSILNSQFFTGLLIGSTPWLLLSWLAQQNSPIVWGHPTTFSGWWWLVTAVLYRPNVLALPASQWLPRLQQWLPLLAAQFTWAGLPLLLWAAHKNKPITPTLPYWLTATAILFYSFTYNTSDALVFTLPALLILTLLLTPALAELRHWAFILPLALLLLNFNAQRPSREQMPRTEVMTLLAQTPPNAILAAPGDETIFVLWYFQHVEGFRPDVVLMDTQLFGFDWYRTRLSQTYANLFVPSSFDIPAFIQENQAKRPYCTITLSTQSLLCQPEQ